MVHALEGRVIARPTSFHKRMSKSSRLQLVLIRVVVVGLGLAETFPRGFH